MKLLFSTAAATALLAAMTSAQAGYTIYEEDGFPSVIYVEMDGPADGASVQSMDKTVPTVINADTAATRGGSSAGDDGKAIDAEGASKKAEEESGENETLSLGTVDEVEIQLADEERLAGVPKKEDFDENLDEVVINPINGDVTLR